MAFGVLSISDRYTCIRYLCSVDQLYDHEEKSVVDTRVWALIVLYLPLPYLRICPPTRSSQKKFGIYRHVFGSSGAMQNHHSWERLGDKTTRFGETMQCLLLSHQQSCWAMLSSGRGGQRVLQIKLASIRKNRNAYLKSPAWRWKITMTHLCNATCERCSRRVPLTIHENFLVTASLESQLKPPSNRQIVRAAASRMLSRVWNCRNGRFHSYTLLWLSWLPLTGIIAHPTQYGYRASWPCF